MTPAEGFGRLQELADRADLATLLARQGLWLDEQRFDAADAATLFTEDAIVHTQGGQSQGLQAITAQARRVTPTSRRSSTSPQASSSTSTATGPRCGRTWSPSSSATPPPRARRRDR
jgi:hypothetical protein